MRFESVDNLKKQAREGGGVREIFEDWKWIISFGKEYKLRIFISTLIGISGTSLSLVASIANKYLIDIVTQKKTELLWVAALVMLGSTVFSIVTTSLTSRFYCRLTEDIQKDVRAKVYRQILDADWQALNRYSNGDILNRINGDTSTVAANAINWLPNVIVSLYNFIATFFVIWYYSKVMSLIALCSAPILLLMSKWILTRQRAYAKESRSLVSKLFAFETDSFHHMDTVKSLGLNDEFSDRFDGVLEENRSFSLKVNGFQISSGILMKMVNWLVATAAFGYALYLLWTNQITYGTMTLFLQQRTRLTTAFKGVAELIPTFSNSSVAAHRVKELIDLPGERHSEEEISIPEDGLELRMRDVDFAYENGDPVIEQGSLHAGPGEMIALVGASGRGKTTLLRLTLGLVYPQSGLCALYRADGSEVALTADTRKLFSYVPQGNTIMAGSIADNLRLVAPEATDAELIHALELADAWEFVRKLPKGIDSPLGERGKRVSEGQAQRIAIARALLRNAPILLLDEATSALDPATEERVLNNLRASAAHRTVILTTHRPSVQALCTRVYRVDDASVKLEREGRGNTKG